MSKKAVNLVENELNGDDDETDFDEMVEKIMTACDVAEKTAASYIYEAEALEHTWKPSGEHVVSMAAPGQSQDTVVGGVSHQDLEMEAGEPTDRTFEFLPVLEDVDHPLVPDDVSYYRRRLEGHKSDIQVFTYDMARDTPGGVQHLLLTGLPGVGKNQAFKKIAAETNRPMIRIPVGGGIRYEDLVGHYTPTSDGELEWTDGILTTAARYGFMVVLDEIDMMTGDVSSPLHQITEDGDSQELVIRQTGEVIKPHPQFRVVATRNPGFAGAKQMNRAFRSRFSEHEVDYLEPSAEVKVVKNGVGGTVNQDEVEDVVEYANELRSRYPQELDLVVTTRDIKRIVGYMAGGLFDKKSAINKVILPRADPDTDRDPLADEIDTRF